MGAHSHGPVSTMVKRRVDGLSTDALYDLCRELDIDLSDAPETDLYDWYRQALIDHYARQAGELQ